MAEQKTVSVEKMDEIISDYFQEEETIDFHGQELSVRKFIPFETVIAIVRKVSDACFSPDTGEYMPEVRDLAMKVCMIDAFTNVRLPQNVEHQCRILYGTDLWDSVCEIIMQSGQYYEMSCAIDERIDDRCNANRVMFERELQKGVDAIQMLGEQFGKMFDGVTPEDVAAVFGALANGGIDEGKIAEAVVAEQNRLRDENPQFEAIDGGEAGEDPHGDTAEE